MPHHTLRSAFLSSLVAALLVSIAACGGSSGSKQATVAPVGVCPVSSQDAQSILGGSVARADKLPTLPGMPAPTVRCQYQAGAKQLELTVFSGTAVLRQLGSLVQNTAAVPGLGPGSYCGGGKGTISASFSCLFVKHASTYVLGLSVPNADDNATMHQQLVGLAQQLASA